MPIKGKLTLNTYKTFCSPYVPFSHLKHFDCRCYFIHYRFRDGPRIGIWSAGVACIHFSHSCHPRRETGRSRKNSPGGRPDDRSGCGCGRSLSVLKRLSTRWRPTLCVSNNVLFVGAKIYLFVESRLRSRSGRLPMKCLTTQVKKRGMDGRRQS